jgi:4-oxalocrotonate tautomerase
MIRVEMFPGRSADQKRALVRELTDAFVRTAGGKPEAIHVVISEVAASDWAVAGELLSERAKP